MPISPLLSFIIASLLNSKDQDYLAGSGFIKKPKLSSAIYKQFLHHFIFSLGLPRNLYSSRPLGTNNPVYTENGPGSPSQTEEGPGYLMLQICFEFTSIPQHCFQSELSSRKQLYHSNIKTSGQCSEKLRNKKFNVVQICW